MKKIFLFLVVILFSLSSFAQFCDYEEVVYLKNSKIYRGIIVEQIPGKSLKLKSNDGQIYEFDISEVDKFTRELKPDVVAEQENFTKKDLIDDSYSSLKVFKAHPKFKPSGFYINSSFVLFKNAIGNNRLGGIGGGIALGGKFVNKGETRKRVKLGIDIGVNGDFLYNLESVSKDINNNMVYIFGINVGPTLVFRMKGPWYFYLTPYTGVNILTYKYSLNNPFPIPSPVESYARKVDFALPLGLKLEYAYKRLFFGGNIMAAYSRSFDKNTVPLRSSLNLGVKF